MGEHEHSHDHPHEHGDDHDEVDCEAALAEIYTYLDGELTEETRGRIAAHLEGCNPCVEVYDFEAELRIVVSTRARSDEVPETLRLRIAEKLTLIAGGDELDDGDEGARPVGA